MGSDASKVRGVQYKKKFDSEVQYELLEKHSESDIFNCEVMIFRERESKQLIACLEKTNQNEHFSVEKLTEFEHRVNYPHPNLLRLIGYFSDSETQSVCGSTYQQCYFVENPIATLRDEIHLRKFFNKPFEELELWAILYSIVSGLIEMRKLNKICRNVSSTTIYVDQEGNYKISELHLAKDSSLFDEIYFKIFAKDIYLSPGQVDAIREMDPHDETNAYLSDIFSLGVVLIELIYLEDQSDVFLYHGDEIMIKLPMLKERLLFRDKLFSKNLIRLIYLMTEELEKDRITLDELSEELIKNYSEELVKSRNISHSQVLIEMPAQSKSSFLEHLLNRVELAKEYRKREHGIYDANEADQQNLRRAHVNKAKRYQSKANFDGNEEDENDQEEEEGEDQEDRESNSEYNNYNQNDVSAAAGIGQIRRNNEEFSYETQKYQENKSTSLNQNKNQDGLEERASNVTKQGKINFRYASSIQIDQTGASETTNTVFLQQKQQEQQQQFSQFSPIIASNSIASPTPAPAAAHIGWVVPPLQSAAPEQRGQLQEFSLLNETSANQQSYTPSQRLSILQSQRKSLIVRGRQLYENPGVSANPSEEMAQLTQSLHQNQNMQLALEKVIEQNQLNSHYLNSNHQNVSYTNTAQSFTQQINNSMNKVSKSHQTSPEPSDKNSFEKSANLQPFSQQRRFTSNSANPHQPNQQYQQMPITHQQSPLIQLKQIVQQQQKGQNTPSNITNFHEQRQQQQYEQQSSFQLQQNQQLPVSFFDEYQQQQYQQIVNSLPPNQPKNQENIYRQYRVNHQQQQNGNFVRPSVRTVVPDEFRVEVAQSNLRAASPAQLNLAVRNHLDKRPISAAQLRNKGYANGEGPSVAAREDSLIKAAVGGTGVVLKQQKQPMALNRAFEQRINEVTHARNNRYKQIAALCATKDSNYNEDGSPGIAKFKAKLMQKKLSIQNILSHGAKAGPTLQMPGEANAHPSNEMTHMNGPASKPMASPIREILQAIESKPKLKKKIMLKGKNTLSINEIRGFQALPEFQPEAIHALDTNRKLLLKGTHRFFI